MSDLWLAPWYTVAQPYARSRPTNQTYAPAGRRGRHQALTCCASERRKTPGQHGTNAVQSGFDLREMVEIRSPRFAAVRRLHLRPLVFATQARP
jgi:hypothetical protein